MKKLGRIVITSLLVSGIVSTPTRGTARVGPAPPNAGTGSGYNVVLIVIDDVGTDLVNSYRNDPCSSPLPTGCPGGGCPAPPLNQPVLDWVAQNGMRFTNAWSNPVCAPTRAQILTGRPGRRTGIGDNPSLGSSGRNGLSTDLATIPTFLRQEGYKTAALGKWHLADESQINLEFFRHPLGQPGGPPLWFEKYAGCPGNLVFGAGDGYNKWVKAIPTVIDGLEECPPRCSVLLDASDDCSNYATTNTADDAISLISSYGQGVDPFFLYLAFNGAHAPLDAPLDAPPMSCTLTPFTCMDSMSALYTTDPNCSIVGDPNTELADWPCFVQYLDHELGRVLCSIDLETTYVIIMGDNGSVGRSSDRQGAIQCPYDNMHKKGTLYQGGIHVPLLVLGPMVLPDSTNDELVAATDMLATVCDLAGVVPGPDVWRDSFSIAPYLFGVTPPQARQFSYAELFSPNFVPTANGQPPSTFRFRTLERAIQDVNGVKLIEIWDHCRTEDGMKVGIRTGLDCIGNACDPAERCLVGEELYDLGSDYFEKTNLIDDPAYASARDALRAELTKPLYRLLP